MRPEHLHYLLEINRRHSISAAAKALRVGQSTLSAIVRALEEEVGFLIFQRASNGVTPTAEGRMLMELSQEIDAQYEELLGLKRHAENSAQPIPILVCPDINTGLPVPLAGRFYAHELQGGLIVEELPRTEIGPRLAQGAANIGVACLTEPELRQLLTGADSSQLHVKRLCADRLYLFVHGEHRLAQRAGVALADLPASALPARSRPSRGSRGESGAHCGPSAFR